jgi:hypothetical protein
MDSGGLIVGLMAAPPGVSLPPIFDTTTDGRPTTPRLGLVLLNQA